MIDLVTFDSKHYRENIENCSGDNGGKILNHSTTLQQLSSNQLLFEQLFLDLQKAGTNIDLI